MRTLVILFCCFCFSQSQGQTIYRYYVKLDNSMSAPIFVKQGNYSVYAGNNASYQAFFNNYQIISFDKLFPTSSFEDLSKILLLETTSATLANNLLINFPTVFLQLGDLSNVNTELMYTPNDYGSPNLNNGNVLRYDLDYINVQKAWDITNGANVTIGISDAKINTTDADFAGKVGFLGSSSYQNLAYVPGLVGINSWHGTGSAGIAAARGDNNYGSMGVCYGCKIIGTDYGYGNSNPRNPSNLLILAQSGVRVINMSWSNVRSTPISQGDLINDTNQILMNVLANNYKVVLVAAAGNQSSFQRSAIPNVQTAEYFCEGGNQSGPSFTGKQYGYPASYDNVISVSSVNYRFPLVVPLSNTSLSFILPPSILPLHEIQGSVGESDATDPYNPISVIFNGNARYCNIGTSTQYLSSPSGISPRHTTNEFVDILAPSSGTFRFDIFAETNPHVVSMTGGGTSASAPYVAGTAALMISVDDCLFPDEVDDILKLTSKDIDKLNNPLLQGQIGAGALDAGDAVEFVNEMKKVNGLAVIDNHNFNRFDFKLARINNNLKIENVTFSDNSRADFTARTQINLKPGTNLKPNSFGNVHLGINPSITNTCAPVIYPRHSDSGTINTDNSNARVVLYPNPNKGVFELVIDNVVQFQNKNIKIYIIDINGRIIYLEDVDTNTLSGNNIPLNVSTISNGMYFVKIASNVYEETLKFIKK